MLVPSVLHRMCVAGRGLGAHLCFLCDPGRPCPSLGLRQRPGVCSSDLEVLEPSPWPAHGVWGGNVRGLEKLGQESELEPSRLPCGHPPLGGVGGLGVFWYHVPLWPAPWAQASVRRCLHGSMELRSCAAGPPGIS